MRDRDVLQLGGAGVKREPVITESNYDQREWGDAATWGPGMHGHRKWQDAVGWDA